MLSCQSTQRELPKLSCAAKQARNPQVLMRCEKRITPTIYLVDSLFSCLLFSPAITHNLPRVFEILEFLKSIFPWSSSTEPARPLPGLSPSSLIPPASVSSPTRHGGVRCFLRVRACVFFGFLLAFSYWVSGFLVWGCFVWFLFR